MIPEIQELREQVETLKSEVETLKTRLESIEQATAFISAALIGMAKRLEISLKDAHK